MKNKSRVCLALNNKMNKEEQPNLPNEDIIETERRKKILSDRCRNFLRQRVPLSPKGQILRTQVEKVLQYNIDEDIAEIAQELPTVENMRLDLFEDVQLSEENKKVVFGYPSLTCVQISDGCTHDCTMCGREDKPLTHMSLITIAKIGQEIEKSRIPVEKVWDDWAAHIQSITGVNLDELGLDWIKEQVTEGFTDNGIKLIRTIEKEFYNHEISKYFEQPEKAPSPIVINRENPRETFRDLNDFYPFSPLNFRRNLNIFNFSDPFDWRDTTLCHEDGQPADLADAFQLLATPLRPIFLSTTGWQENDPLGPIAARKLVELLKSKDYLLYKAIRISVSPTEGLARKDLNRYREHMKKVILGLEGIPLNLVIRVEREDSPAKEDFEKLVRIPLIEFMNGLKANSGMDEAHQNFFYQVQTRSINRWKDRAINPEWEKETDSGACMGGVHILTDSEVAIQPGSRYKYPPKGSRPKRTGLKLYK